MLDPIPSNVDRYISLVFGFLLSRLDPDSSRTIHPSSNLCHSVSLSHRPSDQKRHTRSTLRLTETIPTHAKFPNLLLSAIVFVENPRGQESELAASARGCGLCKGVDT